MKSLLISLLYALSAAILFWFVGSGFPDLNTLEFHITWDDINAELEG